MSKVVFKSPYAPSGKAVGGDYINYMAKCEKVDKSVNTKKVEINLNSIRGLPRHSTWKDAVVSCISYIATRPRVEKVGEHGLFGSKDDVNLNKARSDIVNHNGKVWMPIVSLRREDADRLGYNNADAWRNLVRSKQFEIAEAYNIPAVDAVVKVVCKDDNLQELYRRWCQLQLANQRYYRKHPKKSFDALEKNKTSKSVCKMPSEICIKR